MRFYLTFSVVMLAWSACNASVFAQENEEMLTQSSETLTESIAATSLDMDEVMPTSLDTPTTFAAGDTMGGSLTINDATSGTSLTVTEGLSGDIVTYTVDVSRVGITTNDSLVLTIELSSTQWDAFFSSFASGTEYDFVLTGLTTDASLTVVFTTTTTATEEVPSTTYSHTFATGNVVYSEGSSSLSVAPEPSTTTLSVLALAGLMARRRRKS